MGYGCAAALLDGPVGLGAPRKLAQSSHPAQINLLRIVAQELWDAVKAGQAQMARDTRPDCRKAEFWKLQRPRFLLSGLMKGRAPDRDPQRSS
jgi:hypothetical protein